MTFSEVFIRRPVFAAMLILGLSVFGLISLSRIPMRMNPDVDSPMVVVTTELRGASPESVDREVTDPMEEALNSIEGMRTISSTSFQGLSQIILEFSQGDDVDVKAQEVREKVDAVRVQLPDDIETPLVSKVDMGQMPLITIALGGPVSIRELSDLAEHDIKKRLERQPGVGGIVISGTRKREVRIWLDPLRLAGYDLSIEDVASTLRSENAELAGGRIESGTTEWSVVIQGKPSLVSDFGEMIVAERGGRLVRLRDVAMVEDGMVDARSIAAFNGKPGVSLEVKRQSGADLVVLGRAVRDEMDAIRADLPPGVTAMMVRDYSAYVEEQARSVMTDMIVATFLVVLVVFVFLRQWRSTFIATITIPTSLISTFSFLLFFDLTVNTMTLIALSLAIGMVIDDAIVVLESIYRRIEDGKDAIFASLEGSREVGLAVVSTTLAVCAVFVPIVFMRSDVGTFFSEFGITVTVAVCLSTLIALTLSPALASRMLKPGARPNRLTRRLENGLNAVQRAYGKLLFSALRRKGVTLSVGLCAIVGGLGVASTLETNLYVEDDLNLALITLKLPIGTPLPATDLVAKRIQESVQGHPDVIGIYSVAGDEIRHRPHYASFEVALLPKTSRPKHITETFGELRELAIAAAPEADKLSVTYPAMGGQYDPASFEYSLQGPDLSQLQIYSSRLVARMKTSPIFEDAQSSFESGLPQVTLGVDRAGAADLGLSAVAIGRAIRTLLAGEKVGSFEENGRRYDVRVQVLPEYRSSPNQLALVRLRNSEGRLVPLLSATVPRIEDAPLEIRRRDRAREISVRANLGAGYTLGEGTAQFAIWERELGIEAPYAVKPGGRVRMMEEASADMLLAFVLGLTAIYMVLASLFNSLLHPLTIMLSAPLSFIGGFLALRIAGMPLDILSGIGLLVLMGLVMKNGILLVDYAIQMRQREKLSAVEAMKIAGPTRMRPVLMTASTLIFGLMPAVLSTAVGAEFRAPMAVITIGGVMTSALLTLVMVPVLYCTLDSIPGAIRKATERITARVRRTSPVSDPASR